MLNQLVKKSLNEASPVPSPVKDSESKPAEEEAKTGSTSINEDLNLEAPSVVLETAS